MIESAAGTDYQERSNTGRLHPQLRREDGTLIHNGSYFGGNLQSDRSLSNLLFFLECIVKPSEATFMWA